MDLGSFYIGHLEIYTGDFLICVVIIALYIGFFIGGHIRQKEIMKYPESFGLVREEDLY